MKHIYIYICIITLLVGCSTTAGQNLETTYYPDGALKTISVKTNKKLNGIKRVYRKDGSLATAIMYRNNKIDGFKNTYYPDGSAWRVEIYNNNKLIEISEYDDSGNMIFEQQNY